MNKPRTIFIVAMALMGVWLAGCEVSDPGTRAANEAPTTTLSLAPNEGATVNHYISLRWSGNDPDGTVTGFRIFVDGSQIALTTARDTILAFQATSDGQATQHTFAVAAVDNEGLADPTPASRTFSTINFRPSVVVDPTGGISNQDTVGQAFRLTLAAQDSNPSLTYYSIALDDSVNGWTPWQALPVFLFAAPEIIADTALFPDDVIGISNEGLTAGMHTLYIRAKDAGEAVSDIVSISFLVETGNAPVMNAVVNGTYGTAVFYPDGSVYYSQQNGLVTQLAFSADASAYSGQINAYRFRVNNGDWNAWQAESTVDTTDLQPGEYFFEFMARDLAGAFSDTAELSVRLVQQTLSDSIIVVDETRDGTGNRGSPNDAQVDGFYAAMLDGYNVRSIDYATHLATDSITPYVSPYDIQNAGLIIWHADDRADINLDDNTRLLTEFLNKGGRLMLSGWDVLSPFGVGQGDSTTYIAGSFAREKLRVFSAARNLSRQALGFDGVGDFQSCFIDTAKVPVAWGGKIDYAWTFRQRGEAIVTGRLAVADSLTNPLAHRPAAYIYDQSFRVAVFGVPLYFCRADQVSVLMDQVVPRLLQGL